MPAKKTMTTTKASPAPKAAILKDGGRPQVGSMTPSGTLGDTTRRMVRANPLKEYVSGGSYYWLTQYLRTMPQYIDDVTRDFGDDLYDRMMMDAKVAQCVEAVRYDALSQGLTLQPAVQKGDPGYKKAVEIRDFCQQVLDAMETPLIEEVLDPLMDAIAFGNSIAEKIYHIPRSGPLAGYMALKAIKHKPRTSFAFVVDAYNNIAGILGRRPDAFSPMLVEGALVSTNLPNFLPRDKFVIARFRPRGGDPRGRSLLRPAYTPWWLKQQGFPGYLKFMAQWASPSLVGTTAPDAGPEEKLDAFGAPVLDDNDDPIYLEPTEVMASQLAAFQAGSYMVVPSGSTVMPIEVAGQGAPFAEFNGWADSQIELAITLQALATSEGEHMSRAAAGVHQDTMGFAVQVVKGTFERMVEREILRQLVELNFGEKYLWLTPTASLSETEQHDFPSEGKVVADLWENGYLDVSQLPDTDARLGLPERSEQDIEIRQQKALAVAQQEIATANQAMQMAQSGAMLPGAGGPNPPMSPGGAGPGGPSSPAGPGGAGGGAASQPPPVAPPPASGDPDPAAALGGYVPSLADTQATLGAKPGKGEEGDDAQTVIKLLQDAGINPTDFIKQLYTQGNAAFSLASMCRQIGVPLALFGLDVPSVARFSVVDETNGHYIHMHGHSIFVKGAQQVDGQDAPASSSAKGNVLGEVKDNNAGGLKPMEVGGGLTTGPAPMTPMGGLNTGPAPMQTAQPAPPVPTAPKPATPQVPAMPGMAPLGASPAPAAPGASTTTFQPVAAQGMPQAPAAPAPHPSGPVAPEHVTQALQIAGPKISNVAAAKLKQLVNNGTIAHQEALHHTLAIATAINEHHTSKPGNNPHAQISPYGIEVAAKIQHIPTLLAAAKGTGEADPGIQKLAKKLEPHLIGMMASEPAKGHVPVNHPGTEAPVASSGMAPQPQAPAPAMPAAPAPNSTSSVETAKPSNEDQKQSTSAEISHSEANKKMQSLGFKLHDGSKTYKKGNEFISNNPTWAVYTHPDHIGFIGHDLDGKKWNTLNKIASVNGEYPDLESALNNLPKKDGEVKGHDDLISNGWSHDKTVSENGTAIHLYKKDGKSLLYDPNYKSPWSTNPGTYGSSDFESLNDAVAHLGHPPLGEKKAEAPAAPTKPAGAPDEHDDLVGAGWVHKGGWSESTHSYKHPSGVKIVHYGADPDEPWEAHTTVPHEPGGSVVKGHNSLSSALKHASMQITPEHDKLVADGWKHTGGNLHGGGIYKKKTSTGGGSGDILSHHPGQAKEWKTTDPFYGDDGEHEDAHSAISHLGWTPPAGIEKKAEAKPADADGLPPEHQDFIEGGWEHKEVANSTGIPMHKYTDPGVSPSGTIFYHNGKWMAGSPGAKGANGVASAAAALEVANNKPATNPHVGVGPDGNPAAHDKLLKAGFEHAGTGSFHTYVKRYGDNYHTLGHSANAAKKSKDQWIATTDKEVKSFVPLKDALAHVGEDPEAVLEGKKAAPAPAPATTPINTEYSAAKLNAQGLLTPKEHDALLSAGWNFSGKYYGGVYYNQEGIGLGLGWRPGSDFPDGNPMWQTWSKQGSLNDATRSLKEALSGVGKSLPVSQVNPAPAESDMQDGDEDMIASPFVSSADHNKLTGAGWKLKPDTSYEKDGYTIEAVEGDPDYAEEGDDPDQSMWQATSPDGDAIAGSFDLDEVLQAVDGEMALGAKLDAALASGGPDTTALYNYLDGKKLADSNTNAPSHNKKIQALQEAVAAKDADTILNMPFGSNTYAKKQVAAANRMLKALGVTDKKVVPGQKAGTGGTARGGAAVAKPQGAATPKVHETLEAIGWKFKPLADGGQYYKGGTYIEQMKNGEWILDPGYGNAYTASSISKVMADAGEDMAGWTQVMDAEGEDMDNAAASVPAPKPATPALSPTPMPKDTPVHYQSVQNIFTTVAGWLTSEGWDYDPTPFGQEAHGISFGPYQQAQYEVGTKEWVYPYGIFTKPAGPGKIMKLGVTKGPKGYSWSGSLGDANNLSKVNKGAGNISFGGLYKIVTGSKAPENIAKKGQIVPYPPSAPSIIIPGLAPGAAGASPASPSPAPSAPTGIYSKTGDPAPKPTGHWEGIPDVALPDGPGATGTPAKASGIILLNPDGKVWIRKVSGAFGGYEYSFAKGQVEPGLTEQQNAHKELYEEMGLEGTVDDVLGTFKKTTGTAKYFIGTKTGGDPSKFEFETESVHLVTLNEAENLLNHHSDKEVLAALKAHMAAKKASMAPTFTLLGAVQTDSSDPVTPADITAAKAQVSSAAQKYIDQAQASGLVKTKGQLGQFLAIAEAASKSEGKDYISGYGMKHAIDTPTILDMKEKADAGNAQAKAIVAKLGPHTFKTGKEKWAELTPDDILHKKGAVLGGSNSATLYETPSGEKNVVKAYGAATQAHGEALANKMLSDLGIGAPTSTSFSKGGKHYHATQYDPNLKVVGLKPTKEQATQFLKSFAANAMLTNWDAIGMTGDNLMTDGSGKLVQIDNGGALLHKAMGGLKEPDLTNALYEWRSLAPGGINPAFAKYFKAAGIDSPDKIPGIINQINQVVALGKNKGGWDKYVADAIPQADKGTQDKLSQFLAFRSMLLAEKGKKLQEKLIGGTHDDIVSNTKTFDTEPAAVKYFDGFSKKLKSNLTKGQIDSIKWWQALSSSGIHSGASNYGSVTSHMLHASPDVKANFKTLNPPSQNAMIDLQNLFLHPEAAVPDAVALARSLVLSEHDPQDKAWIDTYKNAQVGDEFLFGGPQSAQYISGKPDWPNTAYSTFKGAPKWQIIFYCPPGTGLAMPTSFSGTGSTEDEVLVGPNARYRVIKPTEQGKDGRWRVHLQVLGYELLEK